jgi:hypothetical protein
MRFSTNLHVEFVIRTFKISMRAMALFLGIALVAPASGLGQLLFYCTMTGEVGAKCCCHHEAADDDSDMALLAAACCEAVNADTAVTLNPLEFVTEQEERQNKFHQTNGVQANSKGFASTAHVLRKRARSPPADSGPPIFIKHCRYLI